MGSAHVQAIEALKGFQQALQNFITRAQDMLAEANSEIERTHSWLEERQQYWQKELYTRQRRLDESLAALQRCQSCARSDRNGRAVQPDCSREQAAVAQARRLVQEAEHELRTVTSYIRRVDDAIANYRHQSSQLQRQFTHELVKACSLLAKSVDILMKYVSQ